MFRSFRLAAACLAAALVFAAPVSAQVRISQVYGGGGNTGATYKQDFIELFNAGTSAVSLNGWSVQYASATGSTWQVTTLTNVTLQPGQYYLVQEAAGAGAQPNLPTPDATGTIAMSGSAGKVALVAATAALTGTCPTAEDVVGFGTTANCQAFATNLTSATSAQRKTAGCTDSGDNNADFEALTPAPRTTATATNACGGGNLPTNPTVTVAASPSTATIGESVLLTATVVPGTNPTSSNVVVLADLSGLGGDAAQRLRDEGTNGDVLAGDNIFSFAQTIAEGTTAGAHALPIGVGDAEGRTADAVLNVTVATLLPIHAIQGNGNTSPYTGQTVVTEGIVTARRNNGFFLQTQEAEVDADPATSEGVFVFTSSAPTATATVGNRVRVQAKVAEFTPATSPHQLSLTELTFATLSLQSTGNALPPVTILDGSVLRADSLDSMERLEGMRVAADLEVVAGVGAFINEANATSPTDGVFFGTLRGVARPMREPGVSILDTTPFPAGVLPPRFDTNPERLRVQSTGLAGQVAMAVDVGDDVYGLVGVLDYAFGAYNLLPDTTSNPPVVNAGSTPRAAALPASDEITVGGFNLLRFFDDVNDPAISDPVLTATALDHRLRKTANAICGYVRAPDILGVVEVENLSVLQDLAATINAGDTQEAGACAHNPQYTAILLEGNDVGGIDVGFLVSTADVGTGQPRVEVLEVQQLGKDAVLNNPDGSTTLLNDRPSLLLRARVHHGNGASREITVIVNHLRSLSDVNSMEPGAGGWATAGARVRAKRAAQAAYLGGIVEARQNANPDEALVLLGDFNALEYNDGFVDSMGIIQGDAADASSVLTYVASPVTRPLTNLAALMPETERYSFSFDGNAQSLDHLLVNQAILDAGFGVRGDHARINADFGEDNFGDWTVPVRVSDHDPVVLYLRDPAFATADLAASVVANDDAVAPGGTTTFGVGIANAGTDAATPVRLVIRLDSADATLSTQAPEGWTCDSPVFDTPGMQWQHCDATSVAAGATASFPVTVVAPHPGGTTLTLTATIDSPMTDPAPANNSANDSVAVTAQVDLAAAVTPAAADVDGGTDAVWGIGLGNAATLAADAPTLELVLSRELAGVHVAAAAGWTCDAPVVGDGATRVHCAAETMAAGSQAAFTLTAPTSTALGGTNLTLTATVAAATADPDAGNDTAQAAIAINAIADLAVRVLAPTGPQKSTKPSTFTIGIANAGPNTATGVVVAVVVNTPASGVLALAASGWSCAAVSGDATSSTWACQRAAFAGDTMYNAIRVTLDPKQAQPSNRLVVAASIAADSTDPVAGNDSSSAWAKVVGK
jgi:predicted extracellular nuclease